MRRQSHDAGNTSLEGNALTNLGMVEIRAGNPRDALTLLNDALTLQRASKNGVGEENALGQLGTAYDAMEPQLAFAYLDSALALAHRAGLRQAETDDLQLIAGLYDESGDHARALEYLGKALPVSDSLGMRKIQGDIARSQARALLALGNVDLARDRADAARRFHNDAARSIPEPGAQRSGREQ
jgi:tetratricopeptide (TPR) repeat protein